MKYHKDLDVLLSEDLSTQKDSCLWEEKQEEVAGSQVAHIRKPVRLFFTDLVLEKVALAWRLWLQSMSRTVYKEPSPGLIVWDGSEIPQMGDTRRGGSFVSSFFLSEALAVSWMVTDLLLPRWRGSHTAGWRPSTWCIWGDAARVQQKWVRLRLLACTCAHAHWDAISVCNQAVQIWGIMQCWIVYSFLKNVHSMSILPLEPSSECVLKPIYFCAVLGFDSLQSSALGYACVGD